MKEPRYNPPKSKQTRSGASLEAGKAIYDWVGLPSDYGNRLGFIYLVINSRNGHFYIGKKLFWAKSGKVRVQSNWRDYFGSSKQVQAEIKEYGKEAFHRIILQCHDSKSELGLAELMYQMKHITNNLCLNGIINVRLFVRPEMKLVKMEKDIVLYTRPYAFSQ